MERFRRDHGEKPIALLHSKFIAATLSQMTPHVARSWLKTLRGLLQFCIAQEMVAADVTQGIKLPKVRSDGGYHTWTELQIAQYEATHPVGSMARLAIALGLYTGQGAATLCAWVASIFMKV